MGKRAGEKKQRSSHKKGSTHSGAKAAAKKDGAHKAKIRYKNTMPRDEAVSYFEGIVAGLREGSLKIARGDESVDLSPGESLSIEARARRKSDKERISFEVSWQSGSRLSASPG